MVLWAVAPCSSASAASPSLLAGSWTGSAGPNFYDKFEFQRQPRMGVQGSGESWTKSHEEEDIRQPLPLLSRGAALRRVTSTLVVGSAALGAIGAPVAALDSQRDPRTAQPPPPALLLPVMNLRVAATQVLDLLGDPSKWEEARSLLSSPPLSNKDFAKVLDRYSDSNWEKHILGDLYRNEGLASIKALDEVMDFALRQRANGVAVTQEDIDDVREEGRALAASLDKFLALAPPDDLRLVQSLVRQSK